MFQSIRETIILLQETCHPKRECQHRPTPRHRLCLLNVSLVSFGSRGSRRWSRSRSRSRNFNATNVCRVWLGLRDSCCYMIVTSPNGAL